MKSFCQLAYAAAIAVAVAVAFVGALPQHSQHQADSKSGGEVVHWTTGGNTKGAAVLNHTGSAYSKSGAALPTKLIASTTDSTISSSDAPAASDATATNGTSVEAGANTTVEPAEPGASAAPAAPADTADTAATAAPDAPAATGAPAAPAAPAAEVAKTTKPIAKKK